MATDDWRVIIPFARLSEVQWQQLLRLADLDDDRPQGLMPPNSWLTMRDYYFLIRQGMVYEQFVKEQRWIRDRLDLLIPALFRISDPPDNDVAVLAKEKVFVTRPDEHTVNVYLRWQKDGLANYPKSKNGPRLTDLCIASSLMCELFVAMAAAHRPLNIEMSPPDVEVSGGSVQFTIAGGMFATGLGLITACAAGLIAAPIVGTAAGIGLATVGAIDLAIGWKQKLSETQKTDFETWEAYERRKSLRLDNEIKSLDLRMKRLEVERAELEFEESNSSTSSATPNSSLVPRGLVQDEAKKIGMSEAHANHTLNRTLTQYKTLTQKAETSITVEVQR